MVGVATTGDGHLLEAQEDSGNHPSSFPSVVLLLGSKRCPRATTAASCAKDSQKHDYHFLELE